MVHFLSTLDSTHFYELQPNHVDIPNEQKHLSVLGGRSFWECWSPPSLSLPRSIPTLSGVLLWFSRINRSRQLQGSANNSNAELVCTRQPIFVLDNLCSMISGIVEIELQSSPGNVSRLCRVTYANGLTKWSIKDWTVKRSSWGRIFTTKNTFGLK
jgi:hypothetical protein